MEFEFDNNIPIYIQLVEQLKIYIISGKMKPEKTGSLQLTELWSTTREQGLIRLCRPSGQFYWVQ